VTPSHHILCDDVRVQARLVFCFYRELPGCE